MLQVSIFLITFVKSYKMACFLALRFSETVKLLSDSGNRVSPDSIPERPETRGKKVGCELEV